MSGAMKHLPGTRAGHRAQGCRLRELPGHPRSARSLAGFQRGLRSAGCCWLPGGMCADSSKVSEGPRGDGGSRPLRPSELLGRPTRLLAPAIAPERAWSHERHLSDSHNCGVQGRAAVESDVQSRKSPHPRVRETKACGVLAVGRVVQQVTCDSRAADLC